jgi:hypothetical protein
VYVPPVPKVRANVPASFAAALGPPSSNVTLWDVQISPPYPSPLQLSQRQVTVLPAATETLLGE